MKVLHSFILFLVFALLAGCSNMKYNLKEGTNEASINTLGAPDASTINAMTKQMAIVKMTDALTKYMAGPNPDSKVIAEMRKTINEVRRMSDKDYRLMMVGGRGSTMHNDVYTRVKDALLNDW